MMPSKMLFECARIVARDGYRDLWLFRSPFANRPRDGAENRLKRNAN
jgi:hypothetical protein